jgi:hypothetical protein
MPADFSEYIDLTPFDVQPGEMYLNAINTAQLALPEFNLRVGSPEDAIFQAMAYLSAVNVASINRLPARLMSGILSMMGVQRSEGIPAELNVTVTADSYDGTTVPLGTLFSFESIFEDEVQEYVFETTEAISIPANESPVAGDPYPSAVVPTQCITPGFIAIVNEGYELSILSSGIAIISAIATDSFSNGIDADSDSDYLARSVSFLSSLTQANCKANQVESYIASNYPSIVGRVKAYDLTYGDENLGNISTYRIGYPLASQSSSIECTLSFSSPHSFNIGEKIHVGGISDRFDSVGTNLYEITNSSESTITYLLGGSVTSSIGVPTGASVTVGEDIPGYVTVFAYGYNEFISPDDKNLIIADVSNRSVAGLTFEILDPDILSLSVEADVVVSSAYDQVPLQDAIKNTVIDYLSPLKFSYNEDRVRKNQLIALISQVPGVIYVDTLTISPNGTGWLPQNDEDLIFQNKGALPLVDDEDISISFTAIVV